MHCRHQMIRNLDYRYAIFWIQIGHPGARDGCRNSLKMSLCASSKGVEASRGATVNS